MNLVLPEQPDPQVRPVSQGPPVQVPQEPRGLQDSMVCPGWTVELARVVLQGLRARWGLPDLPGRPGRRGSQVLRVQQELEPQEPQDLRGSQVLRGLQVLPVQLASPGPQASMGYRVSTGPSGLPVL